MGLDRFYNVVPDLLLQLSRVLEEQSGQANMGEMEDMGPGAWGMRL